MSWKFVKNSAFILALIIVTLTAVRSNAAGCLTEHIREAILTNSGRKPLYAAVTKNASLSISRTLVRTEKMSLAVALYLDHEAAKFEEAGVPVMCSGIVSMKLAPVYGSQMEPGASFDPGSGAFMLNSNPPDDPHALVRKIKAAYASGSFAGVYAVAKERLDKIPNKKFDCLERHFLESIARFAGLAEKMDQTAVAKGLGSSRKLSWRIIKSHLIVLPKTFKLDKMAEPLQERGIPILCQDLPPIEW